MRKLITLLLLILLVSSSIGIGYRVWLRSPHNVAQHMTAAPLAHLPNYVQDAAIEIQVAYQFAIDNPETLQQIPCYCGCEKSLGHKHNLACYVTTFNPDGGVAKYSDHAVYCAVCVDITRVVMKMVDEGKAIQEIHNTIDAQYGNTGAHTHDQESVQ